MHTDTWMILTVKWGVINHFTLLQVCYCYLALVSATLRRRGSFRKPMPWCSLALTQDRMMKSFSLPWNASTLAISTSCRHTEVSIHHWQLLCDTGCQAAIKNFQYYSNNNLTPKCPFLDTLNCHSECLEYTYATERLKSVVVWTLYLV